MDINERIYKLRKQAGMSQEELASLLNVSRQSVSKWEVKESNPDLNNVIKLAEIFNCTSDYLLLGNKEVKKTKKPNNETKGTLIISIVLLFAPFLSLLGLVFKNDAVFTSFLILGVLSVFSSIGLFIYLYIVTKSQGDLLLKNYTIIYLTCLNLIIFQFLLPATIGASNIVVIIQAVATIIFALINAFIVLIKKFKVKLLNNYFLISLFIFAVSIFAIIFDLMGFIIVLFNSLAFIIYNLYLLKLDFKIQEL